MSDTETALLVQIFDRLGSIEAELKHSTKQNDDLKESNEKLEERLGALEEFKARIGGILWVGGLLVSGALFLLWEGLTYLIPWIKTLLRGAE